MVRPDDTTFQYHRRAGERFVIDSLAYGGRTVRVGARSMASDQRSSAVTAEVPAAVPSLTLATDKWHVTAKLPNAVTFVFVVETAGMAGASFNNLLAASYRIR